MQNIDLKEIKTEDEADSEEMPSMVELLWNQQYRENPYPYLRRLREQDHFHAFPNFGVCYILGYEELARIMVSKHMGGDKRLWNSPYNWHNPENKEKYSLAHRVISELQSTLPEIDPPDHKRVRSIFQPFFTPNAVKGLEGIIHDETTSVLDELLSDGGEVDFLARFACLLPLRVVLRMLGLPPADIPQIAEWISLIPVEMSSSLVEDDSQNANLDENFKEIVEDSQNTALNAILNLKDYFRDFIAHRRKHLQNGLIDHLIEADREHGALSEDEILSNLVIIGIAGNDTTVTLLSTGMYLLLQYPDQLALLRENRSLLDTAIEEFLRFEPGTNTVVRVSKSDFTLKDGRTIPQGTMCLGLTNSTNRDPAVFDDPETFDIKRHPNPHQTFGGGFHKCIGADVSRMEARVAFSHLLDRFSRIELRPGARWRVDRMIFRRLETLPVCLTA